MLPYFLKPRLRAFALIALAICPSCVSEAMPPAESRTSVKTAARPPRANASPSRPTSPGRSDPQYRRPTDFSELESVAGKVARASGRKIHWQIKAGPNPGPLVEVGGTVDNCTIYVHPIAARKVSPNTWAFLFGHEFAHMTGDAGNHSGTNPSIELKADFVGSRYAMSAGYRIEAFLGWVLTEPNQQTSSHGSLHQRVKAIAAHFGVPQSAIQEEARRAERYRASY